MYVDCKKLRNKSKSRIFLVIFIMEYIQKKFKKVIDKAIMHILQLD